MMVFMAVPSAWQHAADASRWADSPGKVGNVESIDVVGMFKTVSVVRPLGDNRFLVKYGNHQEVVVTIEARQQAEQRTAVAGSVDCDCVEFMRSGKHDDRCATRRR